MGIARWLRRAVAMACALAGMVAARGDDWPSWRGPAGTGISAEKTIPPSWSAKQNILWKIDLPDRGNSSPIVVGDKVFITQAIEKEKRRTLMCFNRGNGELLWQSGVTYEQSEPTNRNNPYCASSPVTDGKHVYAFFGSAGLFCYDMGGNEIWRRELGKVDNWHGAGSSPILYGDLVILNFGPGSSSALVGCSKLTGEVVWKTALPRPSLFSREPSPPLAKPAGAPAAASEALPTVQSQRTSPPAAASRPAPDLSGAGRGADITGRGGFLGSWSTPLVIRAHGRDELIVANISQVSSHDPLTGKEYWSAKGLSQQVVASPAFAEDTLIVTGNLMSGGVVVLAIDLSPKANAPVPKGDISKSHLLWQVRLRRQCVGSPVIFNEQVFLISDLGFATCLDVKSGQIQWERRLQGSSPRSGSWSSPVLVGDKLLVLNQAGDTFVLQASQNFKLLSTNSIEPQTTCSSPAFSNGQLFIRTHEALWCIGLTP